MRLECLSDWLLCYSSVAAIFFKTVLIALVVHLLSKYSKYRNQHLQSLTMTSRSLMSFRRLDRECKLKPHPRSGHRIVVYNNNIYAIGGYNKNFQEVSNTEATSYPLFREVSKRFPKTSGHQHETLFHLFLVFILVVEVQHRHEDLVVFGLN